MNTCTADECDKEVHVKKWQLCKSHYSKARHAGGINTTLPKYTNTTCRAEGCDRQMEVAGLCKRHYNLMQYHGTPDAPARTTCIRCSGQTPPKAPSGPPPLYCSQACRTEGNREKARARASAQRAEARSARKPNPCSWCEDPLPQDAPGQTRFHPECRTAYRNTLPRDSAIRQCTVGDCDRPVRARDMCSMHYTRWGRATGRIKGEPWDDRRRDNHHRRRARMKGAPNGDRVMRAALIDRDNGQCQLCGHTIDLALTFPNPRSASIDHRIPLSKGGEHSMDNTQLACLVCNIRKSDRTEDAARTG